MKKYILNIFVVMSLLLAGTSCEDYLDKSPDLGLDENTIYGSFEALRGFLDNCYLNNERWYMQNAAGANRAMNPMENTDEMVSNTRENNFVFNQFTRGNWYSATRNENWEVGVNGNTVIHKAYVTLRIANRVINTIDKVRNCTEEQKKELLGQAYFYRAWHYYQLVIRYGGMPKLDKIYNGGDDNVPRMTARKSFDWIVEDLDKAISLLPDRWDDKNYGRPDKAAAYGAKAQALLYSASPLFQNDLEKTVKMPYDKDQCLKAAKACQDCLQYIETTDTFRKFTTCADPDSSIDEYRGIFILPTTTFCHEEYLWFDRRKMDDQEQANSIRIFYQPITFDKNTGTDAQCFGSLTANIVENYERKGPDGKYYPIFDERSGYVEGEWNSIKNRDPRFYNNVMIPGEKWGKLQQVDYYVDTWEGSVTTNKFKTGNLSSANEFGGWICKKYFWPEASYMYYSTSDDNTGYNLHRIKAFYIRVTEMYLDYAEALFEATGDATSAPSGFTMTPAQALNKVRNRVGVTDVVSDYLAADKFRATYRRERAVELMCEGHHRWEDIRRWMIYDEVFPTSDCMYNTVWTVHPAVASPTQWGVPNDIEDPSNGYTFTFKKVKNNVEVRVYNSDMKYYFYPFPGAEIGSLSELKQNPGW